ncbi:MAG TPA: porin [Burkholderiaceae bacterium]|nr:porin [Burkholderiaceae bacterium]
MNRSLIALAVLAAAAAPATAQSNVTLYGIVDVGLGVQSADNRSSVVGVESGYQSGSRFGLRGTEALGSGLAAIFTLEGGYDVSTGQSSQGGRLFGRQAWAGLQSGWGSLVAGRIATFSSGTGSFDMMTGIDPFSYGWGINTLGSTFLSGSLRLDNTLAYISPTWAGLKLGVGYSFNTSGTETAGSSTNTRALATGLSWGTGPFYVVVTYDQIYYRDCSITSGSPCGNPNQKHFQVAGSWDFGFMKFSGGYADQSHIRSFTPSGIGGGQSITIPSWLGAGYDNNAYFLGAAVPLLGGKLLGSYQWSSASSVCNPARPVECFEPSYAVWGLGYQYDFSRRTNLYLGYGMRDPSGTLNTANQTFGGYQAAVGLRHAF